ncbi:MAG: LysM peptidoglycan-binding domain-containing protein [Candidatus Gracilibacteria bacterium]|nr:LysM peptidoglycan-binding domain-containing protein [Candidatus Gracilibacteria bacterium]
MAQNKINLKAKIERHSRILKDNLLKSTTSSNKYSISYKIVLFVIIFVFPFYPALAALVYDNATVDFYRGDIDESSIISSYEWTDDDLNKPIFESEDGNFLSVSTLSEGNRDLPISNEIVTYEIKYGDSIASIASKYGVSRNSIFWANDFTEKTIIHPGQKIKIPPVSGLIHIVKKGDTISSLAKKYDILEGKILAQNLLSSSDPIRVGDEIVIPGGIKKVEVPVVTKKLLTSNKTTSKGKTTSKTATTYSKSVYVDDDGDYSLVKRTAKRSFARGNCTRFVAQYKNVTWGGNAKNWLANARSSGVETGSSPTVGAIVVFSGKGYNPVYGHVGIVTSVKSDSIIVKDMNYRALNEVTTRKVSKNDGAIIGYIYAE